jgi:hypothetical protein
MGKAAQGRQHRVGGLRVRLAEAEEAQRTSEGSCGGALRGGVGDGKLARFGCEQERDRASEREWRGQRRGVLHFSSLA